MNTLLLLLLLLLLLQYTICFKHTTNIIRRLSNSKLSMNALGDYVTVDLVVKTKAGQLDSLFDQGRVSFVVNGGGYLPSIHSVASKLNSVGDSITELIPSAGGIYNEDMCFTVPVDNAPIGIHLFHIIITYFIIIIIIITFHRYTSW